jgi:hypothetical protein
MSDFDDTMDFIRRLKRPNAEARWFEKILREASRRDALEFFEAVKAAKLNCWGFVYKCTFHTDGSWRASPSSSPPCGCLRLAVCVSIKNVPLYRFLVN